MFQRLIFTLTAIVFLSLNASSSVADEGIVRAPKTPLNKTYLNECSACHIAFPPTLLQPKDWTLIMSQLDKHYGDNAALDGATIKTIEKFLLEASAPSKEYQRGRLEQSTPVKIGALPRITNTVWFVRQHSEEVPRLAWQSPMVKTASNCAACHTRADQNSYHERDIVLPR